MVTYVLPSYRDLEYIAPVAIIGVERLLGYN